VSRFQFWDVMTDQKITFEMRTSGVRTLFIYCRDHRYSASFVIGEAVLLGIDGVFDFNGLRSRKHDHEVEFSAFDCPVSDGEDWAEAIRRTTLRADQTSGLEAPSAWQLRYCCSVRGQNAEMFLIRNQS
jgi:hypothetical protein